jgi:hypothetical protein
LLSTWLMATIHPGAGRPERNTTVDEEAVRQELASWDGSSELSDDAKQAMTLVAQSPASVGGDLIADLTPATADQAQA